MINHDSEMDRLRFYQEAALRAMQAYITAHPPNPDLGEMTPRTIRQYTSKCAAFAFEVAERMHRHHGPNGSTELLEREANGYT